jgi:hypothetical protein
MKIKCFHLGGKDDTIIADQDNLSGGGGLIIHRMMRRLRHDNLSTLVLDVGAGNISEPDMQMWREIHPVYNCSDNYSTYLIHEKNPFHELGLKRKHSTDHFQFLWIGCGRVRGQVFGDHWYRGGCVISDGNGWDRGSKDVADSPGRDWGGGLAIYEHRWNPECVSFNV